MRYLLFAGDAYYPQQATQVRAVVTENLQSIDARLAALQAGQRGANAQP